MRSVLIAVLSLVASLASGTPVASSTGDLGAKIDALAEPYAQLGMFDGVVLVHREGKVLAVRTYGQASYELAVPTQTDSVYQIGSISKAFTNAALARQIEAGTLDLDDTLGKFLPRFPGADTITLRMLVDHTSGIPHTNGLDEYRGRTDMTLERSVQILAGKSLDFEPGTKTSYSNGGYDVLAWVMQQAAQREFRTLVRESVLQPMGLKRTGFVDSRAVVAGMTAGYTMGPEAGTRARAAFYPPEARPGGGAMYSTALDVAAFLRRCYSGNWTTPALTLALFGDPALKYQPTGRNPGFSIVTFTDAARDLYIVAIGNNGASLDNFGKRLHGIVTGSPLAQESIVPADRYPSTKRFKPGRYAYEGVGTPDIRMHLDGEGRIVVNHPDSDATGPMIALSGGGFLHSLLDAKCRLEADSAFTCVSILKDRQDHPFRIERLGD